MDHQGSTTQIDLEYMLIDEDLEPKALPYPLLKKITDDFSDKLVIGRGGFAVVYKAILDNGAVAVKRLLSNMYMHEEKFQGEVQCLMKAKHKNIVRFLGYCSDTQGKMESYNGKLVMADVQERLLCFEYLPNGSLDGYITDSSGEIEWRKCYNIIKGVCEGLNYLHEKNIMHLDLKPGNILLDEDMMPKITDFGLSRCFDEGQTRVITENVAGTMGYLAPECYSGEKITITQKFDLYSLGIIIIEMLTGKKDPVTIENVLEIWSNTVLDALQWEQIRVCATIGIECRDFDPAKRPASMKHIIDRLAETECSMHSIPASGTSELLLLQQFTLCFPFEPNKIITFPLQLTNNTDKHVAFRLIDKSMQSSFLRLPLYGLVPPSTPYTLMVTTQEREELQGKRIIDVILHSATLIVRDDKHINTFQGQPDEFFQQMGNAVREVKLKALYTLPRHIATSPIKPISPTLKIICKVKDLGLYSLDTNEAKQWIMIGEDNGHVGFWDQQTQRKVDSLKLPATKVKCVRFIERKQWIVAGTEDGYLYVYDYEKMQKITSFRVVTHSSEYLCSLAVHPTQPYLLSTGFQHMKLWDWDKGWEHVRTFELQFIETTYDVAFISNDTFACSSMRIYYNAYDTDPSAPSTDYTVKVWSLDSLKSNYALSGHSYKVNCLDFFTCHDQDFLVSGSDDHTAKIWHLQKKTCAYTLEAFVSPVTSAMYQPNLQTLIIGSEDGAIYFWSTTNCRIWSCPPTLTRIIKIGCVRAAYHLTCAMGSVVIGGGNTVAIMDIDNVNYQEQSTDYNKKQLNAVTRQHAGDRMSKEVAGSNSKLHILDVHPLELCFPYHPNEPISCSLDLTNNTEEKVAFRLVDKSGKSPWCFTKLPLYGIVPPRSTYTLIVTTKEEMKLKEKKDFDLVIQSSLLRDKYTMVFQNQSESDQFFEEAKEFGNMVHEVILKAVYLRYEEITSEHQNISVKYNPDDLRSMDAHPTKPWILTGHRSGYARVWNHETKSLTNSFQISKCAVSCVKFIARRQWIVAVTNNADFCVYDCARVTKIKKIRWVDSRHRLDTPILAVHPILPYVFTPGGELLDWELGWKSQGKNLSYDVITVAFNDNSIVGGFEDGGLKVGRLVSSGPKYSWRGHLGKVLCLDFIKTGDQQYLISGSTDCTARIWDLQKRKCIHTLQAMSPVRCVLVHPNLPVLITGTEHGIIHVWSSTHFRLKRTINLGGGGPVVGLTCLMGSQRIVIGQENAISTMEIPDDKELRPKSVLAKQAEAELSLAKAEHNETEEPSAMQEQLALPSKSATEAECSQTKAEDGETKETAAVQEQQAFQPKSD